MLFFVIPNMFYSVGQAINFTLTGVGITILYKSKFKQKLILFILQGGTIDK